MQSAQPFCDLPFSPDLLLSARRGGARFSGNAPKPPALSVVPTAPKVCYSTADLAAELTQLAEACGESASIGLPLCAESGLRLRLWRDDGTGECSVEILEARDDQF